MGIRWEANQIMPITCQHLLGNKEMFVLFPLLKTPSRSPWDISAIWNFYFSFTSGRDGGGDCVTFNMTNTWLESSSSTDLLHSCQDSSLHIHGSEMCSPTGLIENTSHIHALRDITPPSSSPSLMQWTQRTSWPFTSSSLLWTTECAGFPSPPDRDSWGQAYLHSSQCLQCNLVLHWGYQ